MTIITAKVLAASTHEHADAPLYTFEWVYPRWIHAEARTHRRLRMGEDFEVAFLTPSPMEDPNLSRNAASSRAIPVEKLIADILAHPAIPLYWGANQAGMQAHAELSALQAQEARAEWFRALGSAVAHARNMAKLGCHKQIVNRLVEPFSHIKVVASGTRWSNFLALRAHKDAEPHIRMLAEATYAAMQKVEPRVLKPGEWHLPYCDDSTAQDDVLLSVARCASTSYQTVDGQPMTQERARALAQKLISAAPLHASPAEHQATPQPARLKRGKKVFDGDHGGNFGPRWVQFRKTLPGEEILTYP